MILSFWLTNLMPASRSQVSSLRANGEIVRTGKELFENYWIVGLLYYYYCLFTVLLTIILRTGKRLFDIIWKLRVNNFQSVSTWRAEWELTKIDNVLLPVGFPESSSSQQRQMFGTLLLKFFGRFWLQFKLVEEQQWGRERHQSKYVKGPVQNQKKHVWNNAIFLPLCCNGTKRDFLDLLQRKLNDTNTEAMYDK